MARGEWTLGSDRDGFRERVKRAEDGRGLDRQTVTGLANPLRTEIHVILSERSASVNRLSRDLGVGYDQVKYEVKKLKDVGLIEVDREVRVRGTVEIFYRALKRPYITATEWPSVPAALQGGLRGSLLDKIVKDAVDAVQAGTYDSIEGAHMSRTPGLVDEEGREEIVACLSQCLDDVISIFEENKKRLAENNAAGTAVTVSILGYGSTTPGQPVESPGGAKQAGTGSKKR